MKKVLAAAFAAALVGLGAFAAIQAPTLAEAEATDGIIVTMSTSDGEVKPLELSKSVSPDKTEVNFGEVKKGADPTPQTIELTFTNTTDESVVFKLNQKPTLRFCTISPEDYDNFTLDGGGATKKLTFTYNKANGLEAGTYTDALNYNRVGKTYIMNFPIKVTILPDELGIQSIASVSREYNENVSERSVKVIDENGVSRTLADFGLTCEKLHDSSNVGVYHETPEISGGGKFTPKGDIPQMDITVKQQIPAFVSASATPIQQGQNLGVSTITTRYIDDHKRSEKVDGIATFVESNYKPLASSSGNLYKYTFVPNSDNYASVAGSVAVTINRPVYENGPNIRVSNTSVTYNGEGQKVNVERDGGGEITITYDGEPTPPVNVGTYAVRVDVAMDDASETLSGSWNGTLTIKPKPVTFTVLTKTSKVFGETLSLPEQVTVTSGVESGDTVHAIELASGGVGADATPGKYEITASSDNDNYTVSTKSEITVEKATPQVATFVAGTGKAGSPLSSIDISKSSVVATNPRKPGESVTGTVSWAKPTEVLSGSEGQENEYDVIFTPNNVGHYTTANGKAKVTISGKDAVQISVSSTSGIYNRKEHPVSVALSDDSGTCAITYSEQGKNSFSEKAPVNAGTYDYKVVVTMPPTSPLTGSEKTGSLIITPATPIGVPTISGTGTRLSNYTFDCKNIVGEPGDELNGSAQWDNPNQDVVAGQEYHWTFTPGNANYTQLKGTAIPVKATTPSTGGGAAGGSTGGSGSTGGGSTGGGAATEPEVDLKPLGEALYEANTLMTTAVSSEDGKNVPPSQNWVKPQVVNVLERAIVHGQNELTNATATQKHIDHTKTTLDLAMSSFENSKAKGGSELNKAASTVSLPALSMEIVPGDKPTTFTVGGEGDGGVIAISNNHDIAYAEVEGNDVTITGLREGSCEFVVVRAATATHASAMYGLLVEVDATPDGFDPNNPEGAPVVQHRLYNQWSGEHLYTTDEEEFNKLIGVGWTDETAKNPFSVPSWSEVPVYRLYNPWSHEHLYTSNVQEYEDRKDDGWIPDFNGEPAFYSDAEGEKLMYRFYNPYAPDGPQSHTCAVNEDEIGILNDSGYQQEDVIWRGGA